MKTGMTRPLDSVGRITLPKEIRDSFGWNYNDKIEISIDGNKVILEKPEACRCAICSGKLDDKRVVTIQGVTLCEDCVSLLRQKL